VRIASGEFRGAESDVSGALGSRLRAKFSAMRVFLARHAEAEPGHDIPDHARALTTTGVRESRALGAWLGAREFPPAVIRCSSATRAIQTARQIADALAVAEECVGERELYLASDGGLASVLRRASAAGETLVLVGHNPGMAQLAMRLARGGEPSGLRRLASRFPPAACAEIEFGERLADGEGTLVGFFTPDSR
jgi:phosphohistidine phosphatase